jgi:hypothetical protein
MFRISWKEETGKSEEGYGWARAARLGPLSVVDMKYLGRGLGRFRKLQIDKKL